MYTNCTGQVRLSMVGCLSVAIMSSNKMDLFGIVFWKSSHLIRVMTAMLHVLDNYIIYIHSILGVGYHTSLRQSQGI